MSLGNTWKHEERVPRGQRVQFAETFGEQVQLQQQRSQTEQDSGLHSAWHKENSGDGADVTP